MRIEISIAPEPKNAHQSAEWFFEAAAEIFKALDNGSMSGSFEMKKTLWPQGASRPETIKREVRWGVLA
jgi:hypothetical protein